MPDFVHITMICPHELVSIKRSKHISDFVDWSMTLKIWGDHVCVKEFFVAWVPTISQPVRATQNYDNVTD